MTRSLSDDCVRQVRTEGGNGLHALESAEIAGEEWGSCGNRRVVITGIHAGNSMPVKWCGLPEELVDFGKFQGARVAGGAIPATSALRGREGELGQANGSCPDDVVWYARGMRVLVFVIVTAVSILPLHAQQTGGSIDVPAGARLVLEARGEGVQIYGCSEVQGDAQGGFKWVPKGPDAKLLDDSGRQMGTHFAGPTWKLADGSQVVGELTASKPSPDSDSVAWLLLRAKAGTSTGQLAEVAFIRRTETHGGVPNAPECGAQEDVGKSARIPYSATYTFYSEK